ncbi:hypothetical protein [Desulfoluna butyratoxydans]|uniref:hypothetical protein n=1 Tax=Desulfoluna butyratoxydans TaxID=231438 RepID=UPI0015D0E2D7|nr:hypothetical protein [Desulfoluna butyratoxydans]
MGGPGQAKGPDVFDRVRIHERYAKGDNVVCPVKSSHAFRKQFMDHDGNRLF